MPPPPPPIVTKLWNDPEVYGRIYLQAQMIFAGSLVGRADTDRLYGVLFDVMHKLTAMRYFLEGYRQIEPKLYAENLAAFREAALKGEAHVNSECFELIFMFEGFAFQLKSALDMLVKVLDFSRLKNKVGTHTYGDKGDDIIDDLRKNRDLIQKLCAAGNKTVSPKTIARIDALVALMESARDSWLKEAVGIRDDVSHYKAAKEFVFVPFKTADGTIDAARPVFRRHGHTVLPLPLMKRLFVECADFCQEFMCRALNLRVPFYDLSPVDPARAVPVGGPDAHFIKWEWMMENSAIEGMINTGPDE
jgi:hypothetical protein